MSVKKNETYRVNFGMCAQRNAVWCLVFRSELYENLHDRLESLGKKLNNFIQAI
jgi:hypothetical protein